MSIFFKYFKNYYEESPIKLVDIGALGGIPKHWKRAKDYLQVIGFEPNKNTCQLELRTCKGAGPRCKAYNKWELWEKKSALKKKPMKLKD